MIYFWFRIIILGQRCLPIMHETKKFVRHVEIDVNTKREIFDQRIYWPTMFRVTKQNCVTIIEHLLTYKAESTCRDTKPKSAHWILWLHWECVQFLLIMLTYSMDGSSNFQELLWVLMPVGDGKSFSMVHKSFPGAMLCHIPGTVSSWSDFSPQRINLTELLAAAGLPYTSWQWYQSKIIRSNQCFWRVF